MKDTEDVVSKSDNEDAEPRDPSVNNDVGVTAKDTPIIIPVLDNDDNIPLSKQHFGDRYLEDDHLAIPCSSPHRVCPLSPILDSSGNMTQPLNGTATPVGPNILYTPAGDFCGIDQFTYTVIDSSGEVIGSATVTINVSCQDTIGVDASPTGAPTMNSTVSSIIIANDDFAMTVQNVSVDIFVLLNDTVPPGKTCQNAPIAVCN